MTNLQKVSHAEVPPHDLDVFSWREILYGINSGAWAIVLSFVVIFWATRKSLRDATVWVKDYIRNQQKLNEQLQETVKSNSETLRITGDTLIKMAENDRVVAQALSDLSRRQDELEDEMQLMADIAPSISKTQQLQVKLLTEIHKRVRRPDDDDT